MKYNKATPEMMVEIKLMRAQGAPYLAIAERFGISRSVAHRLAYEAAEPKGAARIRVLTALRRYGPMTTTQMANVLRAQDLSAVRHQLKMLLASDHASCTVVEGTSKALWNATRKSPLTPPRRRRAPVIKPPKELPPEVVATPVEPVEPEKPEEPPGPIYPKTTFINGINPWDKSLWKQPKRPHRSSRWLAHNSF